jgi:hypothetical protein
MSGGEDLSQETLIKDTIQVLNFVNEKFPGETTIIVGHSMGGSIATKTCAEIFKNKDWGLGIGDWGLGIGPNPQSPIPNPQSPIPSTSIFFELYF